MRGKRAKAIRRLVYQTRERRKNYRDRQYVGQKHRKPVPGAPEMNYERIQVYATGDRRVYLDAKRTIKSVGHLKK